MKALFLLSRLLPLVAWALLLACLTAGCRGKGSELQLESKNFEEQIEQEQNLVFRFDRDLVPDSLLNRWDTIAYVTFNPAVRGQFKWTAPHELVFSPARPFAPATDYTATFTKNLLTQTESKSKLPAETTVRFHTPYLALEQVQAFWVQAAQNPAQLEARLELAFNYPVAPGQMLQHLRVRHEGKDLPAELVSASASGAGTLAVRVRDAESLSQGAVPLQVTVGKGLSTSGSARQTTEELAQAVELPSRRQLQVVDVSAAIEQGQERIYVLTTQPVGPGNLQEQIKLEPRVNYSVERLENGFVLKGSFLHETAYTLTLAGTLAGVTGKPLGQPYRHPISFDLLRPGVSFVHGKGNYLISQGSRLLALNLVQVPRVKVSVARVYENNILHYLRQGKSYHDYYDEATDRYYYGALHTVDETAGTVLLEREYDVNSLRKDGNQHLLPLNLSDLDFDSQREGLYVVTVTSTEQQWLRDSKIISVTDIGLIAKQGRHEVMVFANSLREAEALPGVEVRFISTNNQVIFTGTTGQDGSLRFPDMDRQAPEFQVGLITARLGSDFTYLPYNETLVNTSRFEVGGKRTSEQPYEAFIYGDRDLYRPGDTLHVNTVVRTANWQTVAGLPVKLKLILPNGKEYRSYKGTLNAQGAYPASFYLAPASVTGTYTLEVYSGNDVLLNTKKIGVEEFMPDRLKVTATLNKTVYRPGEKLEANLTAQQLFGPPAAGRNYELQLSLKKKHFEAKKYPDYTFDLVTSGNAQLQNSVRQGQTDEQGQAQETFELSDFRDLGLLAGSLYTTVFDETGRPVNRLSGFEVATQPVFFGLGPVEDYVSTRQPLRFPLLALDRTGQPVAATAQVQLVRFTYESVIERYEDQYNYNSQRRENVISTKTISIPAGGTAFTFTPVSSGDYEIRIARPGAASYVAQRFYAYGWGDTQSTSFAVNNEGEVTISPDKESYEVGEEAKLLFTSPFPGKILVTVEQDKVLSHFYLQTDKKTASLTLPIKDAHLPTVYVTATALRPIKDNQMPLTIARGFRPLTVTKISTRLPVILTAPETSRSRTVQTIQVRTAPNAEVTVAVVDEGILQLKNYVTPDPHGFFYQKRALETKAYDLYPFLLPELSGRRSSTGGDGFDLAKRINPLTSKRVKLVSLWSGILQADGKGEATVRVQIPEFSGAVRVMAVAYKDQAFGSAEQLMRVSDPVVISTALPRFLSPRDTLVVPVTLSNTTAKAATASSTFSVSGPLRVVGAATQSAQLKPNSEARVVYKLVASPAIGQAAVTVAVKALGETFRNHTDITVRPIAPLTKLTGAGSLQNAATATLQPQHDFLPATVASRLVVSKSPVAQFTDDITFLLQYPHGCLEQTVSTAFPLLYYTDLARSLQQDRQARTYNPNYLVQEAIIKIEAMQQYDGGFVYWPGSPDTHWWSSAYASHFLLEAQKAGYAVNANVLGKALTYLQRKVKDKAMEEYRFYDQQGRVQTKFIVAREAVYTLYVLSVAQRPDWASMNAYKTKPELLSLDARYVLASAYALNGQRESFRQLVPKSFSGERSVRALGGSFYSPLRDQALALNALLEADPDNPQIGTMSRHLSEELRSTRWYNTQERGFALLALGKLMKRGSGNQTATVARGGKSVSSFTGQDVALANPFIGGSGLTLKSSGQGTLYYFWEVEGVSQSGRYPEEDQYIRVRKTFFDRNGNPVANNTFKQNDLVVVRVTLQSLDSRAVPNVAITDLLPAGFEIENPRLTTEREFPWLPAQKPATPDYVDIRDDRINLYATARPEPQHFFYQVRAVTQGDFQMGPVGADAMYNAEYHSYHGGGVIRVR